MKNEIKAGGNHSKVQNITVEKVKRLLPKGVNVAVSERIVEAMNRAEEDIGISQAYMEEQLLGNINIIKSCKISMEEYVNAVKYCALKQHMSNSKAWAIVFPDRYDRLVELKKERAKEGREDSINIDSHVSSFNKTEAVLKIDEQMFLADHLQYAPLRHYAIKKQYDLSMGRDANGNPVSPNVQHLAAAKLYDMVKVPEDKNIELKVGMTDEAKKVQLELIEQLAASAAAQKKAYEAGNDITDVQVIGINITDGDDDEQ